MRKKADPKNKLVSRLFEQGLTAQLPSLERPRVFSLQKPSSTLTAKIVKVHRDSVVGRKQLSDLFQPQSTEMPPISISATPIEQFEEERFRNSKNRFRTEAAQVNSRLDRNSNKVLTEESELPALQRISRAGRLKASKFGHNAEYDERRWATQTSQAIVQEEQPQPIINMLERMSGARSRPSGAFYTMSDIPEPVQPPKQSRKKSRDVAPKDIDAFILMCRQQQLSPLEFVYTIKQESNDYYNVKMINFNSMSKAGIKNYFTLSARGVTKYENSAPVEFKPLEEWIKERNEFNEIKELSFFQKFRKWKSMKKWLKILSQERFKKVSEVLSERLFILNPDYRSILIAHNSMCYDIEHFKLVELPNDSLNIVDFKQEQFKRRNQVVHQLKRCSKELHEKCETGLQTIVEKLRTTILSDLSNEDNEKKASDEKSKAFEQLGFPDNIRYGHRSSMRAEFIRFLRLAYLLDFVVVQSLGKLYVSNVKTFLDCFTEKNSQKAVEPLLGHVVNTEGQLVYKQATEPYFTIEMNLQEGDPVVQLENYTYGELKQDPTNFDLEYFMKFEEKLEEASSAGKKPSKDREVKRVFSYDEDTILQHRHLLNLSSSVLSLSPNKTEVIGLIQEIFTEGQDCIQVVERWSKNESFLPYIRALEEWDQIIGEKWTKPESLYLNPSHWIRQNDIHKQFMRRTKALVEDSFGRLEMFKQEHQSILTMFWRNHHSQIQQLANDRLLEQTVVFEQTVKAFTTLAETMKNQLILRTDLGIYLVDCIRFSEELTNKHASLFKQVCQLFIRIIRERSIKLRSWYTQSIKSLTSMIIQIDEFVQQKHSLDTIQLVLPKIKEQLDAVKILVAIVETNMPSLLKKEEKELTQEVYTLDVNLFVNINEAESQTTKNMERFKRSLKERLEKMIKEIDELQTQCDNDKFKHASTDVQQAEAELAELGAKVRALDEAAEKHRYYEEVLELTDYADFQSLDMLKDSHKVKYSIFKGIKDITHLSKEWNELKFKQVKVKELASICEKFARDIMVAERTIPQSSVTPIFKKLVWLYRDSMPVIVALRSQYLRDEHWKEVKSLLKSDFSIEDDNFTLSQFLQLPVQSHQEEIIEISVRANQQYNLRRQVEQLEGQWSDVDLRMKNYKESNDLFVLYEVDEVLAKLDEGLATTSNLLANKYIKPIRAEAQKLYADLSLMQEIVDKWLECQKKWIYLENIFAAPDIKKQLQQQSADFTQADKFLKQLMKRTYASPKIMKLLKAPGLLDSLVRISQSLDQIEKQLEDYLEVKRRVFPRFYFLSNDQLLEILAKSQNLEAVEQHLNKCFEGLVRLMTEKQRTTIIDGMISPEGERVKFITPVNARSNVENWLLSLQKEMVETLKKSLREGLKNFVNGAQKTRKDWILKHKGQVVTVVSQILWTLDTEDAIKEQPTKGDSLAVWYNHGLKQLQVLTEMVRGELTELSRKILVALITTDVHNRDIVNQLNTNEVESITDNYWQQQLRYYSGDDTEGCIVRQVTASMDYGYQYLGATSRLVITPLTDRCWITITSALANQLGASPAGPAGTGKTESTKDLAKGLGRLCIVFNCSDQITAVMMNKLFSGLIQQGAWTCLDEFNRIDIEVLSVIAQQLLGIRIALKRRADEFEFEGKLMPLKKTMGVFITMNPGYAGRTELPDNLKSLFRPVSMMIPDYAMIAEIMLFAEGFENASELSKKMVQLYKLSSEQLSQQDHYDFGMRAVKSLLVMAGALKRADTKESEDVVLIRAMKDSNIPKFLKDDIPLFEALVQDLFPSVKIKEIRNDLLEENIADVLVKNKLQPTSKFITKVVQLFDIFNVRFGVMLVGQTGSGKTACYKMLAETMTKLKAKNIGDSRYQNVSHQILNPKSVSMGELYGFVDEMTQEWVDGIASQIIRQCNTPNIDDPKYDFDQKYWVVFDGPVDALWIENMNTVLDDNMTLCLANSERIKLRSQLRMLFEVQDLAVASPATVSRCGMVYLSSENLNWKEFVTSWFSKNCVEPTDTEAPQGKFKIASDFQIAYKNLFFSSLDRLLEEKRPMFEPFPTTAIQTAQNICTILSVFLRTIKWSNSYDENIRKVTFTFAFSFVWAAGGSIESKHYQDFEAAVKLALPNVFFPKTETIFDFLVNTENHHSFVSCQSRLAEFEYSKETPYFELLVPTVDITKFSYMLECMLDIQKAVLFTGGTGVGKSVFINNLLFKLKDTKSIVSIMLNCSAQTKAKDTQLAIEAKLHKKGKTLFGSRPNESIAIFIDDINMPAPQFYGAQPTIELLRQFLDQKGFYDRTKLYWKDVVDTTLIACGATPGGGRNQLSRRFLRHFLVLCMPQPSDSNMKKIFQSILKGFLHSYPFPDPVRKSSEQLTLATLQFYKLISTELLPTPSKFHYTFNLRDISKVFQGMLMYRPQSSNTLEAVWKLWYNELSRVFADRLVEETDREWFGKNVTTIVARVGGLLDSAIITNGIIFSDVLKLDSTTILYEQVSDLRKVAKTLEMKMELYNMDHDNKLTLVFFDMAVEQVIKISRIIRQPRGNAMLIGVGGSGKQSLSKLASFIMNSQVFQIEMARNYNGQSFRGDLQKLVKQAAFEQKGVSFIFTDLQIAYESFLEDINNLINTGEVPNLFSKKEDIDEIYSKMRPIASKSKKPDSFESLWNIFISEIRSNLHVVLCMSPVGEALRLRCRKFPSLVNCCTLDWFASWPKTALYEVAKRNLEGIDVAEQLKQPLAQMCMEVSVSVSEYCVKFFNEQKRKVYTTPKSYLDQLQLYNFILKQKLKEINSLKVKLSEGLSKLYNTNETVAKLKEEMKKLQPVLEEQSRKTERFLVQLDIDRKQANKVEMAVEQETDFVNMQANEIRIIKEEAQAELNKAIPALKEAEEALNKLNKNDVTEIKGFSSPPAAVQMVMEAVCILLGEKTEWAAIKQVMMDMSFIDRLKTFDRNNIPEPTLKRLRTYTSRPDFDPVLVGQKNLASKSMCMWCKAMDNYSKVAKEVEPKKKKVAELEAKMDKKNKQLAGKTKELNVVRQKVAKLQKECDETVAFKNKLEADLETTANRLVRAEKLTHLLADEGVRWKEQVEQLKFTLAEAAGDVFLSACTMSYMGPFTGAYRQPLMSRWIDKLKSLEIPMSKSYSLSTNLENPIRIRDWILEGLPNDSVSVDNAIVVKKCQRWPLLIDPQGQANRWIKRHERDNNLKIINFEDTYYLMTLQAAVRSGYPVLLENVEETLDTAIESVLQKQIIEIDNMKMIKLGGSLVNYSPAFKLYMTTKLANPHYLPQIFIKVTIINFSITFEGLQDQLLGEVMKLEKPQIEKQRDEVVVSIASSKKSLEESQNKILELLAVSTGMILDDVVLIETLEVSKADSIQIIKNIEATTQIEEKLNASRNIYVPVAVRGTVLYFVVSGLSGIDPMYQYSLSYFKKLFRTALNEAEPSEIVQLRIQNLNEKATRIVFTDVSCGLFESHKKIFSFLICTAIKRQSKAISDIGWSLLLRGAGIPPKDYKQPLQNPDPNFYTANAWYFLTIISQKEHDLNTLLTVIKDNPGVMKEYFESDNHIATQVPIRTLNVSNFAKLLLLRAVCPEKLMLHIGFYVQQELGNFYEQIHTVSLEKIFQGSDHKTPVIFVLSQGADPTASILRFSEEKQQQLGIISLGQGQGKKAAVLIDRCRKEGGWVLLQNCHLAKSWMGDLQKKIIQIQQSTAEDDNQTFRLMLTSMPADYFPVSILQNSIKMTIEPPRGLKANLKRSFADFNEELIDSCPMKKKEWLKMLYSLTFFHAVIQERRKFGPLGFNIRYEFNESDLEISIATLRLFLNDDKQEIPWEAMIYMTGHINYGGRVTDDWDRVCLLSILKKYYTIEALTDKYCFSESETYFIPNCYTIEDFRLAIETLPNQDDPVVFGLHDNANLIFMGQESNKIIETILSLEAASSAKSETSPDAQVLATITNLSNLPAAMPTSTLKDHLKGDADSVILPSLTTFLLQEVTKFNNLLNVMKNSLVQLEMAIKGLVVMSQELDEMYTSFLNNTVPNLWKKVAYSSLKPLSSWIKDLKERVLFISDWFLKQLPNGYWMSGFFFPQGFLTGVLQTHARKYKIPIDTLAFKYRTTDTQKDKLSAPKDGVYIYGLFLDGARWDSQHDSIVDQDPNQIEYSMPVIHFLPVEQYEIPDSYYHCPCYKTSNRVGVLSTTGQSTNFILAIDLNSKYEKPEFWTLRGTALVCQLNH